MRKIGSLFLVLVFLISSYVIVVNSAFFSVEATGDSWTSRASMHEKRSRLGVAEVNGKIYAIGGDYASLFGNCIGPSIGGVVGTTEEYNPETDSWVFKASMPTPRCSFAVAVYQNKIYCIGGFLSDRNVTGVNEVYDPATNTWETKTAMPTPRMDLQAHVVNGKIYLIGGRNDYTSYLGVNEVYDPETDTWTTKTSAPNRITSAASAAANGKIYVLATASSLDLGAFLQIYSPEEDKWSVGAASPTYGGWSTTAGVTSGSGEAKIVFFSESATYMYSPGSGTWAVGTVMPTSRGFTGVATIGNTFYVIGGIAAPFEGYIVMTTSVATNEQYTPEEGQPLSADNKMYIRADGSIEPATANITTDDKVVYTFTGNNYERLIVQRDNIVVDGNGYTLQGTDSYGVALFQRTNVTIRNLTIREFQTGCIGIDESMHIVIFGNNLQESVNDGIRAYSSSNNLIAGNNITSSKYMSGIYLVENSDNNLIYGNNILDNSLSFFIRESKDNQIHHNNIVERFQEPWVEEEYSNIWDNGTEGNYWSNYTGTDANHDGIGDTAYIINDGNKDNYPLMTKIDVSTITLEEIGWKQKSPEASQEDQTTPEPSQEDTSTPKPAQGTTPTPEASQEDQTTPEPFPTALTAASITAATAISVGLLGYFKKRKR